MPEPATSQPRPVVACLANRLLYPFRPFLLRMTPVGGIGLVIILLLLDIVHREIPYMVSPVFAFFKPNNLFDNPI